MPKLKYRPSRDIPEAVRILGTTNAEEICRWILNKYNVVKTQQTIYQWFYNHPDIKQKLEEEIIKKGVVTEEEEVKLSTFEIGVFENLDCVKEFIDICILSGTVKYKHLKGIKAYHDDGTVNPRGIAQTLNGYIKSLRIFCMGVRPRMNPETQKKYRKDEWKEQKKRWKDEGIPEEEIVKGIDLKKHGWVLKHPCRITIDDVNEYLLLMTRHYPDVDNSSVRLALRNFFERLELKGVSKISGRKHKSAGGYADLFVEKSKIKDMLGYMREKAIRFIDPYYVAYVACLFMFETGTRISATLNARLEHLKVLSIEIDGKESLKEISIWDKGHLSVHGEKGHRWEKHISDELYKQIRTITGYPDKKEGLVFNITADELRAISREALEKFCPEIWDMYPDFEDVVHFWRHMYAQHMLRLTGWNYGVVSALGGWSVKGLEESYGKPSIAILREWGLHRIPELTRWE